MGRVTEESIPRWVATEPGRDIFPLDGLRTIMHLLLLPIVLTLTARAQLSWSLASGNESWPADKRTAIVAAMNEAVALYNANGYFPKSLWANYNASVPTAQASYSGWIDFGGQIGTRTALHEISHTLGVGQYSTWSTNQSGGKWTGSFATNRVKLFDGASANLNCDLIHFWPYGLNYADEDGATNRVRHIKMVAAMRRDMGIVTDSDGDGIPNDWEMFHFGNLTHSATGDADGDRVTNLAEYNADTDPAFAVLQWIGATSSGWTTAANWSAAIGATANNYSARLNVNNAAGHPLVYDATLGSTVYRPADRGLVIGSGAAGGGAMTITGGSFSTVGASSPDVIGNSGNTASLAIDGGSFTSTELQLGVAGTGTGTLTVNSGSATVTTLAFRFGPGGSGSVHLNGGTLATATISRSGGTGTLYLNGGTLRATAGSNTFIEGLSNTFVKSGGITIDTSSHDISIAQALKADPSSPGGGLAKTGTGSLTPTGSNTYTGPTTVSTGILVVRNTYGVLGDATAGTTVASDATLALSATYTPPEPLILSGTGQKTATPLLPAVQRGALQGISGTSTWNGPIEIASGNTRIGVQDGAALTLTGSISEALPNTSVIFRPGMDPGDDVLISGPCTWTGATTIFSGSATGGALKLGADNVLPTRAVLQLAGNGVQGRLDLNGHDQTAAGLTNSTGGSSPIGAGLITNTGTRPSTLTLSPSATRTFIGTIQDGSQVIHLVKSGASTQVLTNTQAYGGNTTINGGILRFDQACLADPSSIVISTGGKLHLNFTGSDTVSSLTLDGVPMPPGTYGSSTYPAWFQGTGSLNVLIGPTPFDSWIAGFPGLTETQRAPTADPDSDGRTNLEEFAFGGSPASRSDNGIRQVLTTDSDSNGKPDLTLTLEIPTGAIFVPHGGSLTTSIRGITCRIQGTTDLTQFDSPVSEVTPHLGTGTPHQGYSFRTFRLDASDALRDRGFIRAQAISP